MTPNKNLDGKFARARFMDNLYCFCAEASAQVQTKTTTREGQSSQAVRVERGEVLAVEGNDLLGASHSWRDSSQKGGHQLLWGPTARELLVKRQSISTYKTRLQRPRRCTNL